MARAVEQEPVPGFDTSTRSHAPKDVVNAADESARPSLNYDAFISYSRIPDDAIAEALQNGLQRLTRPWYRIRPTLRIFRDKAGFAAGGDLTQSIADQLDDSRALILLLSPEATTSPWVDEEVAHWRAHRPHSTIIPVVTVWRAPEDDLVEFDWNGADVPPSLRGHFEADPLAVDLRWAHGPGRLTDGDPRFLDALAQIAAGVLGRNKDDIVGETVRMRRRARRLASGAIAALVLLTLASIVAGVVAVANARRAEERARVATSRQLAAQSVSTAAVDTDLALLLAVESSAIEPTSEALGALIGALNVDPQLERYLYSNGGSINDVVTTSDGKLIGSNANGHLSVWNLATGEEEMRIPTPAARPLWGIDIDVSQKEVIVGDVDGDLFLFDLPSATAVRIGSGHEDVVTVARFVDGGSRVVTASEDGTVRTWAFDGRTLEPLEVVRVGEPVYDALVMQPDGWLVLATAHRVSWWHWPELEFFIDFPSDSSVNTLAFSRAGDRIVAAGDQDGVVTLNNLDNEEPLVELPVVPGTSVRSLEFSPDGRLLYVGATDGTTRVLRAEAATDESGGLEWSVDEGRSARGHTAAVTALVTIDDGDRIVATSSSGEATVRSTGSSNIRAVEVATVDGGVMDLGVSETDEMVLGALAGPRVIDLVSGRSLLPSLSARPDHVTGAAIARDGSTVALGTIDGTLIVWDSDGDELIAEIEGHHGPSPLEELGSAGMAVLAVSIADEEGPRVLSGGVDGDLEVWTPDGSFTATTHSSAATGIAIGGDHAVSTGGAESVVFDPVDGSVASTFQGAGAVAMTGDGRLLATGSVFGGIDVWNVELGDLVGRLSDTAETPTTLAFGARDRILAAGYDDHSLRLWSVPDLTRLGGDLTGHDAGVTSIAFGADGSLYSADWNGAVLRWDLDPASLIRDACVTANRALSERETITFIGDGASLRPCAESEPPSQP
ncbi:TIR domain-containing protein [Ilumatobacter sp.]|uniref:TIR domain-containing protein n=1 Tax=Ilumatobacter sp. TaxID=1967498 RepID=UPI003AF88D41